MYYDVVTSNSQPQIRNQAQHFPDWATVSQRQAVSAGRV